MSNAPQPSIRFLLAREAPVGVLLRRGPSELVQCLLWNLETDEVTPGQWFSGRIHLERSDLSPDGRLFVYFAANYKPKKDSDSYSWTAISRPPYFTALALWFKGPTYYGGGLFESDDTLLVNDLSGHEYAEKFPMPRIKVQSFLLSADHVEEKRMMRDGWKPASGKPQTRPRVLLKSSEEIEIVETFLYRNKKETRLYTASIGGHAIDVNGAKQVDIDIPRSRIVYTIGGKLIAHNGTSVKEIADLTANRFEPVPPADWSTVWP